MGSMAWEYCNIISLFHYLSPSSVFLVWIWVQTIQCESYRGNTVWEVQ